MRKNKERSLRFFVAIAAVFAGLIFTSVSVVAEPQRFAESRFVRELVSNGFVDGLYKNR